MKIKHYTTDKKKELAKRMDVTLQMINKWGSGQENMSKTKSVEIESASKGETKRYEAMFPEVDFNRGMI